jgi:hypothetical protein
MKKPCLKFATLTIMLSAVSGECYADDSTGVVTAYTMSGSCERLVMNNHAQNDACGRKIMRMVYASGRNSFVFTAARRLVSFNGVVHAASNESLSLDIDHVTVIGNGRSFTSNASGACLLQLPLHGQSHLSCHALATTNSFVAEFRGDGTPPIAHKFVG